MRGVALLIAVAVLAGGSAVRAQSLGEVAAQEKERREKEKVKEKAKPAQSFSDDDLKKYGGPKPKPGASASPGTAGSVPSAAATSGSSSASGDRARQEQIWRSLAAQRRAAVQKAQARVDELQAKVNSYLSGMNPEPVMNPGMYQQLEADKAQAIEQLEAAKGQLATAQKALADFEEQARTQGIPPGWLRE